VGYDDRWQRDIGYGVPATCDHPGCGADIDRGLACVCAGEVPYGGEDGCGLYFCGEHLGYQCERCAAGEPPFEPTPDVPRWMEWKLGDDSWAPWRARSPEAVARMNATLGRVTG
jgi:hypothetical protein